MSHVGTDFDGLASMVLAQKLYPGSFLVFPGRKGPGVKEFYDLHKRHFPALPNKEALAERPDRLIVVDTRTPSRLGGYRQWFHDNEVELHIYDHHPPTAEAVRGDQEWVEPVGAAATLLVERCREEELPFSCEEATLALIAIHEETGSFRYSSTTPRDLQAAALLMESGANMEVVGDFLKDPLSEGQRRLLEEFLKSGELISGRGGKLFVASARRKRSVYGLGLLAARILEIEGTDAVCLVLEVAEEGTSVAGRAGSDAFDISAWMDLWGGGGHKRAAAASHIDQPAEEVVKSLKSLVERGTPTGLKAREVMSTDLFSVDLSITVEKAYEELLARGFHSACVLDEEGKLQGLVCRTDLTKALDHNLGHAPARSVMTHKVVSVNAEDTLDEVRQVVVERNVGSLPVLDDGELVGILTRTDLLRELYQEPEKTDWRGAGPRNRIELRDTAEPFLTWIKVATEVAMAKKVRLYAVGGFVRDLLLGRHNDDLDLVVEGDAGALAAQVAKRLEGKLIKHEKYMTACVKFDDNLKLDIATARREVYVRPAALPEVAQSKLKSDLYRRDFTVNALALRLDDRLGGTVIDFFGGRQDLDGKKIRVLHNHSFFDDPTRVIRAVRFEQRLGFSIEPHTKQLIRSALEADVFELAHGERMAEEFRLALSENDPLKVLARLEKLKVLKAIHPELQFRGKTPARVERGLEFLGNHPEFVPEEDRWLVPLLILGFHLTEEARRDLTRRFGWRPTRWAIPLDKVMGDVARRDLSPSEVADYFDQLIPLQIAVLAGIANHPVFDERLEYYLRETRDLRPLLTGDDILESGVPRGPEIARWKKAALDARRNDVFQDRAGALEWLRGELSTPSPAGRTSSTTT